MAPNNRLTPAGFGMASCHTCPVDCLSTKDVILLSHGVNFALQFFADTAHPYKMAVELGDRLREIVFRGGGQKLGFVNQLLRVKL
jgi:hypothetical protein